MTAVLGGFLRTTEITPAKIDYEKKEYAREKYCAKNEAKLSIGRKTGYKHPNVVTQKYAWNWGFPVVRAFGEKRQRMCERHCPERKCGRKQAQRKAKQCLFENWLQ